MNADNVTLLKKKTQKHKINKLMGRRPTDTKRNRQMYTLVFLHM